ncbi:MAG: hypothetical protein E4H42_03005 [Chromatiales bacterium]|nr:MAG: hypothetical protein E4H42_03005 [Chromatiales bacterium]
MALTAKDIDRVTAEAEVKDPPEDAVVDRGDGFVSTDDVVDDEDQPVVADEVAAVVEEEADPVERDPNTGKFIPKARFDEMSQRSRASLDRANARIAELEQQSPREFTIEEVDAELDKLETQYTALLIDGKTDEATQLRGQIRGIERRFAAAQAASIATGTREQIVDSVKLNDIIDQLEEEYPFLDPKSPDYSDEVAQETLDLYEGLIAKGWAQSIAMQRAAGYVLNSLDIEYEDDPAAVAAPAAPARADQARRAAVKRGLEVITRQPPVSTGRAGEVGSPREVPGAAVGRMAQKDFEQLSDEQLQKLRGDDFDGTE